MKLKYKKLSQEIRHAINAVISEKKKKKNGKIIKKASKKLAIKLLSNSLKGKKASSQKLNPVVWGREDKGSKVVKTEETAE